MNLHVYCIIGWTSLVDASVSFDSNWFSLSHHHLHQIELFIINKCSMNIQFSNWIRLIVATNHTSEPIDTDFFTFYYLIQFDSDFVFGFDRLTTWMRAHFLRILQSGMTTVRYCDCGGMCGPLYVSVRDSRNSTKNTLIIVFVHTQVSNKYLLFKMYSISTCIVVFGAYFKQSRKN